MTAADWKRFEIHSWRCTLCWDAVARGRVRFEEASTLELGVAGICRDGYRLLRPAPARKETA